LCSPHSFEKSLGRYGELHILGSGGASEALEFQEIRLFIPALRHDSQAGHRQGELKTEFIILFILFLAKTKRAVKKIIYSLP